MVGWTPKHVKSCHLHLSNLMHSSDSSCSSEPDYVLAYVWSFRCDNMAFKKLMSNFGSSRSEESCSAVVELLERVTKLQKELELKESQEDIDMDQVQTITDLHHTRVGCCSMPCAGPAGNSFSGQCLVYIIVILWLCACF